MNLPSVEQFGDVGPLVSVYLVSIEDYALFFVVYWRLFDAWVEMIMPSFPTLLSSATANMILVRELLGDECPSFGTILCNQVYNCVVLLLKYMD